MANDAALGRMRGGGGVKTISDIFQTGVQEFLHCVYGNNP